MKSVAAILAVLAVASVSCSGRHGYDPATCEELSIKIERHDSLTQTDYSAMIDQNEQILRYLIEESERLQDTPDDERYAAFRELLAEPVYRERFSYLFTLGSTLYQADELGLLDRSNARAYRRLDEYNARFAAISDRM